MTALGGKRDRRRRRETGVYYTPPALATMMVERSFAAYGLKRRWIGVDGGPRILDPSCGDGAFVLSAFDHLCRLANAAETDSRRVQIVRRHLFGVDLDERAVGELREKIAARLARCGEPEERLQSILAANFRTGDALTGRGFAEEAESPISDPSGIDWPAVFPDAAGAGGFDLILGNPPYRRELNARSRFDRVAASPLGRWREPRMDYWYFFLHRGLDLLKPGGRLSFVVHSYWTASTGARRLIGRLQHESALEEVILFGAAPLFNDVQGQHLVFRLRKHPAGGAREQSFCRVVDLSTAADPLSVDALRKPARTWTLEPAELFHRGGISLQRPDPLLKRLSSRGLLGEVFEVRQGIAENPPVITSRQAAASGGRWTAGAGVFVLHANELAKLRLSPREAQCLRPYFRAAMFDRYRAPDDAGLRLIYSTPQTIPDIRDCAALRRHLEQYRPLLEARREVQTGSICWWHLHWPREERLFEAPRIVCLQMSRRPAFAFAESPGYVGFALNVIVQRREGGLSLPALAAILNSSLAARWFERSAKRRGANLEINGHLLRDFPLPPEDAALCSELDRLSRQRHALLAGAANAPALEAALDQLVNRLYGIG